MAEKEEGFHGRHHRCRGKNDGDSRGGDLERGRGGEGEISRSPRLLVSSSPRLLVSSSPRLPIPPRPAPGAARTWSWRIAPLPSGGGPRLHRASPGCGGA